MHSAGVPELFTSEKQHRIEDVFQNYGPTTGRTQNDVPLAGTAASDPVSTWVKQELEYCESQYTEDHDLHVCVTTFNVGKEKLRGSLQDLCELRSATNPQKPMDVIILAFQEIDMRATALFREETSAAIPWVIAAQAAVGADRDTSSTTPYYAFPHKQLVGMLLCVFVRRELLEHVKEFAFDTVATGVLHSVGNKGAIGVHLLVYRTSLCIITAHLASGEDKVRKRNDDINTILKNMDFNAAPRTGAWPIPGDILNVVTPHSELLPRDHDLILIAGDFNYRVELTYERAVSLATCGDITTLLRHDQLTHEMANPHSPWAGFQDLTPTFLPTYRFNVGTSTYDTTSKRRVPSYTDRIVYWAKSRAIAKRVRVDGLRALDTICLSDHKPVQALLRLPVRVEVPHMKNAVARQLFKKVQKFSLDRVAAACVSVDPCRLDFGVHKVMQGPVAATPSGKWLRVTNTGSCTAVVRILRRGNENLGEGEGEWLRVEPLNFVVLPGESREVGVGIGIDPGTAPWLSRWRPFCGKDRLKVSAMLLISVRNGPLVCVECKTVLKPSIFGNSLSNLMRLGLEPCENAYRQIDNMAAMLFVQKIHVPKEIWYLVNAIVAQPCATGLFTKSIDPVECFKVIDKLDSVGFLASGETDPHTAAECLVKLLQNFQEPVIPFDKYEAALHAGEVCGKAPLTFLSDLPTIHANVFKYIIGMLVSLLTPVYARTNGLTIEIITQIFSNVLIIPPPNFQEQIHECLRQGGGVDQDVRRQIQRRQKATWSLLEFFLSTPPNILQC